MKYLIVAGLITISVTLGSHPVYAGCGIESGSIRILANDFPALRTFTGVAAECESDTVEFVVNHTAEHSNIAVAAMTPDPPEYTARILATSTLVTMMNEDLVQSMDELVERYGEGLTPMQLIEIDGSVMSVAFMANTQHLIYRADILEAAGLEVPTTVEEVIEASRIIREKGLMENPFAAAYKAGWNLGEEFVNMFLGHGGEFFKAGTALPNVNNEIGVATLTKMKGLTEYMNPDYLTLESEGIKLEWEAGNVALMFLWASRAPTLLDDKGSTPEIVAATTLAAPVTVSGGDIPVASLWWDGFSIAKNASEGNAEASFRALVRGAVSKEMANDHSEEAVWLVDGFVPGPKSIGVIEAVKMNARPYPMIASMGLLHAALGEEIVEFLQGQESAEQALADVEAAYMAKAREAGFID